MSAALCGFHAIKSPDLKLNIGNTYDNQEDGARQRMPDEIAVAVLVQQYVPRLSKPHRYQRVSSGSTSRPTPAIAATLIEYQTAV